MRIDPLIPIFNGATTWHEGLSWKLSQDSMLTVTPEWFYQGSKVKKT